MKNLNKQEYFVVSFFTFIKRLFSDFHYFNKHDYDQGPSIFHSQVIDYLRRFKSCLANKKDNRTCAYDLQTEYKVVNVYYGILY